MKKMMRSLSGRWRLFLVAAVAAAALVVGILIVHAEPVPRTFVYQGVLTDAAGAPITGDHSITMRVFTDASTGTALCTEVEVVTVTNGLFRMTIGDGGCTVDPAWFTLTAPVYLGITVDTTTLTPRAPLFPVASAYQAEHAERADRLIVRYGADEISVGGIYCGSTMALTGAMGGYSGTKSLCETACGDSAAHLCGAAEVVRSAELGISVPAGWLSAGTWGQYASVGNFTDCDGWTYGGGSILGQRWDGSKPTSGLCNTTASGLCCL
jgi:hypothetical protein